jgi:A/G-specific adenine glycosylase
MELGARVCLPRGPKCSICPLATVCKAFRQGTPEAFALPSKAPPVESVEEACAVVCHGLRYLVARRPGHAGRYRSMWEFPSVEIKAGENAANVLAIHLRKEFGLRARVENEWAVIRHRVTHHQIAKRVFLCAAKTMGETGDGDPERRWALLDELDGLAMSSPHRRIAALLKEGKEFFGEGRR